MNIVIVGDGKVGSALAEQLSNEGHNITVIDNNADPLSKSIEKFDVIGVNGNGATLAVQREAGVPDADLLIAATSTDEVNMLCCMLAKKLGTKHTIARIRNPEYLDQLVYLKDELGLSMTINPENAAARDISQLISFPSAITMGSMAKGKVDLIEVLIDEGSPFTGKKLSALKHSDFNVLVCAVERDGNAFIPDGEFILRAGDRIHITGANKHIGAFLRSNGKHSKRVKKIMVVGGGKISYYFAKAAVERGLSVKIIEKDAERCRQLCELVPGAMIINGDGTDQELLESEDISSMDAFVALTNIDEENIIVSMFAAENGVSKVISKINREGYMEILDKVGIGSSISPKKVTTDRIIQYVRAMENSKGSNIRTLYKIIGGKAEVLEFFADGSTKNIGMPLKDIALKKQIIIAAIVRHGKINIPRGGDTIECGDTVILVAAGHRLTALNDIFA